MSPDPSQPVIASAAAGASRSNAISLFTGAGGLDNGCERAGFATRAAVEVDTLARETLLTNAERYFPALTKAGLFGDIVALDYDELLAAADLEPGATDLGRRAKLDRGGL